MWLFDSTEIQKIDSDLKALHKTDVTVAALLEKAISLMLAVLEGRGLTTHLDFERDQEAGPIKGIVVFDSRNTTVIPVTLTHKMIRVKNVCYFLGRDDGLAIMLDALVSEFEKVLPNSVRQ